MKKLIVMPYGKQKHLISKLISKLKRYYLTNNSCRNKLRFLQSQRKKQNFSPSGRGMLRYNNHNYQSPRINQLAPYLYNSSITQNGNICHGSFKQWVDIGLI